jgi:squalene-hopene/tetraprenyl-beta-curcumene cyclase
MSISQLLSKFLIQKYSLLDSSSVNSMVEDKTSEVSTMAVLDKAIIRARIALLEQQRKDGHWCFPLEADCTIPAEYILMMHFMDEVDSAVERRIANFLRAQQVTDGHGGWPLYYGGDFDMSCSVKVYYALKLAGDSPEAPHMVQARNAILERGGAARSNVFTRLLLAMYQQIPWRGVPLVPAEIILLPRWFPFHLSKVAYWSRTVVVPLSVLCTLKAKAINPRDVHVQELFTVDPQKEKNYFPVRTPLNRLFLYVERAAFKLESFIPAFVRRKALKKAEQWIIERLNGKDGLGAIFPAMVNAYEALILLGHDRNHPLLRLCRQSIDELLVNEGEDITWCQPCVSPIWDTVLSALALQEDKRMNSEPVRRALDWVVPLQILDQPGDWRDNRPHLPGGGWAFQYANPHYPDLDDTAVSAWALYQADKEKYHTHITRAANWLAGMQSSNGGFAAFDVDNEYYYLNEIPFADHGALLDPPTSDLTARCIGLLALNGEAHHQKAVQRGIQFLLNEQETSGAWFGRWGSNYIYGTWSVLEAFRLAHVGYEHPAVQRAVQWLKSVQRADGGWGETNDSYLDPKLAGQMEASTSFQTAWAVLALMAAGEIESQAVERGISYLINTQTANGLWEEPWFTAPGFPRVFYLKYHGYSKFFPLWALNRYHALNSELSAA